MRNWLAYGVLLLLLAGCSWGEYQIPKQDYREHIQVLGVMPLLVDRNNPLDYPQPEQLFDLLQRSVQGKHLALVERLREKKGYFDVRTLSAEYAGVGASPLEQKLAPDKFGRPLGYQLNRQVVADLAQRNALDALLLVVVSGAQVEEKRFSRNLMESLRTRYDDVVATAMVVDRSGQLLWQLAGSDAFRIALLQYADFDEAYFNRTDLVRVKNITLEGVAKSLAEPDNGALPEVYDQLFKRIASGISPSLFE